MSIIDKFVHSMTLAGACSRVLFLDKELLVFPLLSLMALCGVFGGLFGPVVATGGLEGLMAYASDPEQVMNDPAYWVVLFILYFLCFFVVIFFNAALIYCAMIRLFGGDPTVMDGLRSSWRVLPHIFAWSLFAASVKLVLDFLASRSDFLTRLVASGIGMAWGIATYFAVPVLVVEEVGPISAIRQSASTIRKTWGEALITHVGLAAFHSLILLIAFLLGITGSTYIETQPAIGISYIAAGVVIGLLSILIVTTLNGILRAALYVYAVQGKLPEAGMFDETLLRDAFERKR
ncbi:DUF6159 family protein [Roseibium sp.]|uniref:DUF6159 family protein n=1 Tax=Roseibium sp. TaxID=1936156 RepID=UPI003A96A437